MVRRFIEVRCPHHLEASAIPGFAGGIGRERTRADEETSTLMAVAVVTLPLLALLVLFGPDILTFAQQHWASVLGAMTYPSSGARV